MKKRILGAALAAVLLSTAAYAAGLWPTLPAPSLPMSGSEILPCDTGLFGGAAPQTEQCSVNNINGYFAGLPSRGNALIGGDAGTNLWQRGTAGVGVSSTAPAYNSADRWAIWTGAGTEFKLIRSSTAADLPTGYQYAFKFQRTASQTGVLLSCMAQEIESLNAYQFRGQTAELDLHAYTGANFSAANSQMTAYIVTGTGADEGIASLQAGTWTGQANAAAAVVSLGGVSTAGRYSVVATIPATVTEIAVELCYKPVGTAGANDYIAFDGIQLIRNGANAAYANATTGYNATLFPAASFERRPQGVETSLQQRYYYALSEARVANALYAIAPCAVSTTSLGVCTLPFPVTMRIAPTMAYTTGFGMTVAAQTSAVACTALATGAGSGLSLVSSPNAVPITCASSAGFGAAGTAAILTGMASTSAGIIGASAEL